MGPKGITPSALHSLALKGRQTGTHVTRTPRLLYDVSVWNKLFRRSFWDQHQLSYPEGVVWEDLRLMTKAHVLARAVDVIPDIVYYWRERAQGGLSITQSRTSVANLRDRMTAMNDIDQFIAAHSTAKLLRAHQRKALKNDLWLYVQDLHKVTDAYRAEFADLVNGYLDHVGRRVLRSLPATHKLAYYLVRIRAMPQLAELAAWLVEQPVRQVPVVRQRGRLRADLPFRVDSPVPVPSRVFRPHWRDLDPFMYVDDIEWEDGRLVVTGRANVPSVDIPRRRNTSKILVLRPPGRRLPVVRPVRSFFNPAATALSEQDRSNYDWSGFRFAVSPRRFRGIGEWQCYMLVRGHGVWRPARVHSPVPGPAERPRPRQVAPGLRFGARWAGLGLNLAVWRLGAMVAAVDWQDAGPRSVRIDVELPAGSTSPATPAPAAPDTPAAAELVLVRNRGAAIRSFPATPVPSAAGGPARFSAVVPLGDLAGAADVVDRVGRVTGDDGMAWDVYLKQPGRPRVRVAWPDGMAETRHLFGAREAVAGQSRYGDLVISERAPRPVIDEHEWQPGGRLVLRGSFLGTGLIPGTGDRYETVLRRIGSADSHVIGFAADGERFSIEAGLDQMPFFGSAIPLRDGEWNLYVRPAGGGPDTLAEIKYDHDLLGDVTGQRIAAGRKQYRLVVTGHNDPVITAEPQLRRVEQGNFGQRALRRGFYPAMLRSAPVRNAVFFVSWKGKQCTGNPLGIAEELRRRGDDREHLWAVTDWSVPVPEGGTGVLRGTEEYYEALARSKYLISNDDMQLPFRKRDGQFYLQTWHGTPLKRIHYDVLLGRQPGGLDYLDRDVARWDVLLSPNPVSTPAAAQGVRLRRAGLGDRLPAQRPAARPGRPPTARAGPRRLGLADGRARGALRADLARRPGRRAVDRRCRFDLHLGPGAGLRATLGDDRVSWSAAAQPDDRPLARRGGAGRGRRVLLPATSASCTWPPTSWSPTTPR